MPLFFNGSKLKCLLVGGGETAYNKAQLLLKGNINLHVVAEKISASLHDVLVAKQIPFDERKFENDDIINHDIIVIATNDKALNESIWRLAKKHNKWVNVVDDGKKCDFIFPAIVNRDNLTIAISTDGVAPTIASWLRGKLETELPQSWSTVMRVFKRLKLEIRKKLPSHNLRRRFYHQIIENTLPTYLRNDDESDIEEHIVQQLDGFSKKPEHKIITHKTAKVYLVGGGPGDPELITMRAKQILQQADIVLYDRLISRDLLEYARRDAQKIYVGKQENTHHKSQQQINQLLVEHAQQGRIVVRLKGGDPLIFARCAEEMAVLDEHGIDYQIVPGISAINGVAASLGISLTLRGVADKLLITSVYKNQQHEVNWQQLASPRQTLVFYMGLGNLEEIAKQLIAHQLPPKTPIALVEKGTWKEQKEIFTTVESIAKDATVNMTSPVLVIIGEVLNYRKQNRYIEDNF